MQDNAVALSDQIIDVPTPQIISASDANAEADVLFVIPNRSREAELMDDASVDLATFRNCLADIERVNRAFLGHRPTLHWLDGVARKHKRLRILDVGSGRGDMLRQVWHWAKAHDVEVELTGMDLNPWATQIAQDVTPGHMSIRYETGDIFDIGCDRPFDIVLSSLFTHHLPDSDLVRFVRWMQGTANVGWFINDLHRHDFPDFMLRMIFRLVNVHHMVKNDAPASVRRAFVRSDLKRLLDVASIPDASTNIAWHFPFRWGVGAIK